MTPELIESPAALTALCDELKTQDCIAVDTEFARERSYFPHIGCQMVCSKLTESDFDGFAKLFREVGVDYVAYKSLQQCNAEISVSSLLVHIQVVRRVWRKTH